MSHAVLGIHPAHDPGSAPKVAFVCTANRARSPFAAALLRDRLGTLPIEVESFGVLEPDADGFRNFIGEGHPVPAEHLLAERAFRLSLSAPEMTVLVGGLRALGANAGQSTLGVFTRKPGTLTNDFFVNLLEMDTEWKATSDAALAFEGRARGGKGDVKWTASRVDLVFGSNSELRALAEVYASSDSKEKFVSDFAAAWNKVMNLDRFDVKHEVDSPVAAVA